MVGHLGVRDVFSEVEVLLFRVSRMAATGDDECRKSDKKEFKSVHNGKNFCKDSVFFAYVQIFL